MFEGTGLIFLILFLIFIIVYITVKICIGYLLKRAEKASWPAYVPFYTTYYLVNFLNLKISLFFMSFIPFVGLYYLNIIIKKLLEKFGANSNESLYYVLIPMVKFPELVFRKPRLVNDYDLTSEFIDTQNVLFNTKKSTGVSSDFNNIQSIEVNDDLQVSSVSDFNSIAEVSTDQDIQIIGNNIEVPEINTRVSENNIDFNNIQGVNVDDNGNSFSDNTNLFNTRGNEINDNVSNNIHDISNETYFEAPKIEKREEKPAVTPLDKGKPQMCPNCGARLASNARACFLCGYEL